MKVLKSFILGILLTVLLFSSWRIKVGLYHYSDKQIVEMIDLYDAMTQLEEYFEWEEYTDQLQKERQEPFDDTAI